jgi:hypothetical protein
MLQAIAKTIGEKGCYYFSLLRLVGFESQALEMYESATAARAGTKPIMDKDCYINDPSALLKLAVGGEWKVRHELADYMPTDGELEILRFERVITGATLSHFVVGDGKGKVAYDPLGKSQTVRLGKLVSKRIVKRSKR